MVKTRIGPLETTNSITRPPLPHIVRRESPPNRIKPKTGLARSPSSSVLLYCTRHAP